MVQDEPGLRRKEGVGYRSFSRFQILVMCGLSALTACSASPSPGSRRPASFDSMVEEYTPDLIYLHRYFTLSCGDAIPPVADITTALNALDEAQVYARPSEAGADWIHLGYNLRAHKACNSLPGGGAVGLGRAYLRAVRTAAACLSNLATPRRTQDAARLLALFQSGGVPLSPGAASGPPLKLLCPSRAEASRRLAIAYAELQDRCADAVYPHVSVVRDDDIFTLEGLESVLAHESAHIIGYDHNGSSHNLPFILEACCFKNNATACSMLRRDARPKNLATGRSMVSVYESVDRVYFGFVEFWPRAEINTQGLLGFVLGLLQRAGQSPAPLRNSSVIPQVLLRLHDQNISPSVSQHIVQPHGLSPLFYVALPFGEAALQLPYRMRGAAQASLKAQFERHGRSVLAPEGVSRRAELRRFMYLWGRLLVKWAQGDEGAMAPILDEIQAMKPVACGALAERTDITSLNYNWAFVMAALQDDLSSGVSTGGHALSGPMLGRWDQISQFCVTQSTSR